VGVNNAPQACGFRVIKANPTETKLADAIYCQVMDLFSGQVPEGLRRTELDSKLKNGEISVREFVACKFGHLSSALLHTLSQYQSDRVPVPALTRSLQLLREIRQYNKLLAEGGLKAAVDTMVNSPEYAQFFGEDVVPYRRPLPGNYLGSVKAAAW